MFEACELLVSLLNELDDDELEVTAFCLLDTITSQAIITAVSLPDILRTGQKLLLIAVVIG